MNTVAPRTAVAIPVRNEAEHVGDCVRAIALQAETQCDVVVLALNNCTDATASIVHGLRQTLPASLVVLEHTLPSRHACAGVARRIATEHAAGLLPADGVLLTTDADGRVAPDWVAANLHHLRNGAGAVMGCVHVDPLEQAAIADLLVADPLEREYVALVDEIRSRLDPVPHDPWPCHSQHSGASIAVRAAAYRDVGGMPALPSGEDDAFYRALLRADVPVRHANDVHVTVSGRLHGRAEGGMADMLRRRRNRPEQWLHDTLGSVDQVSLHAGTRAEARRCWRDPTRDRRALARASGAQAAQLDTAMQQGAFGACWAAMEAISPRLAARRVAVTELPGLVAQARALRRSLSLAGATSDPDDNGRCERLTA